MQHILSFEELSATQIQEVLDLAHRLKAEVQRGNRESIFQNRVLGLLFEKPSLRTRVSFQTLMAQHGGSSMFLGQDVGWRNREPARDFFPILTTYLDILVIRAKSHESVVEAAEYSSCPIINGLTDRSHPCQALADIMTVAEHVGSLDSTKIAYVGDANNVAYSLAQICDKLGIHLAIAAPHGYQFDSETLSEFHAGCVTQSDDPHAAVRDADFIYTDVWVSMGQEDEAAARRRAFKYFTVDQRLMKLAAPGCRFLHCLPARRGEEVSADVIDGPQSLVIQQAANRLHAQKGLVAWLL